MNRFVSNEIKWPPNITGYPFHSNHPKERRTSSLRHSEFYSQAPRQEQSQINYHNEFSERFISGWEGGPSKRRGRANHTDAIWPFYFLGFPLLMVSYFPYLKKRMGFIFVFPPLREKSGPTDGAEYIHRLHLGTRAACTRCVINSFLFFFFLSKGKSTYHNRVVKF